MPLNQQPKLQWSVPFPNGPVTISVMTKTTTPSVDLMEAMVGIIIAASVSALKCQKPLKDPGGPLKDPWKPLKNPQEPVEMTVLPHTGLEMVIVTMKTTPPSVDLMEEIVVIMKWRATPTTVMFANAWNTQRQLKPLEQTVLPHIGLEITFVMVKIVVTTKDQDGITIVLIVNVLHKFYVKKYLI